MESGLPEEENNLPFSSCVISFQWLPESDYAGETDTANIWQVAGIKKIIH